MALHFLSGSLLAFLISGLFFYVLSGRLAALPRCTVVTTVPRR